MKIPTAIKYLLPGIFLLGYNIGTGSVTAMAKAGADYGMSLLWALFISCLVTYIMINLYGRYTIFTGETALAAFRKHIHPAVGIFFIVALTANVSGSIMGVMGIIADICYEWTRTWIEGGIKPVWFALFFITVVYGIFLNGRMQFFQNAMAIIVAVMAVCFIINFFILAPPLIEIAKGMIPNIPKTPGADDKSSLLVIASMVGTTVFSGLFIIRTTLVKEAGWSTDDLKVQRRDAFFSGLMMFIISAIIMAAAAGTLFVEGKTLEKPAEMIRLLEPLAGPLAVGIFTLGIVAAGVSSQFPNVLLLPWLLCDYSESERDMKLPRYRIMVLLLSLLGLVVPVFHARPVAVMIASQAFGALILPVTVACILYLGNRKSVVGDKTYSIFENIVLGLILIFALYSCASGLIGLADTLGKYI